MLIEVLFIGRTQRRHINDEAYAGRQRRSGPGKIKTAHDLFNNGLDSRCIKRLCERNPFVSDDTTAEGLKRFSLVMFLEESAIVVKASLQPATSNKA